jgi:hypothetical protein
LERDLGGDQDDWGDQDGGDEVRGPVVLKPCVC